MMGEERRDQGREGKERYGVLEVCDGCHQSTQGSEQISPTVSPSHQWRGGPPPPEMDLGRDQMGPGSAGSISGKCAGEEKCSATAV